MVLRRIDRLGFLVTPEKTDVVLFSGRICSTVKPLVRVGRTFVCMSPHMRYLGVLLDSKLIFQAHFEFVKDKFWKVTRTLCRLMPNLRGPLDHKRRLYANVLISVALYGTLIWCDALLSSARARRAMRAVQRVVAIRACSAYWTVSFDAATLLARLPPWDLLAVERKRIFERLRDAKELGHNCGGSQRNSSGRT